MSIHHVCAWCGTHLRTTEDRSREQLVSHAICEPCRARIYAAAGLTIEVTSEDRAAAAEYQEWAARRIA